MSTPAIQWYPGHIAKAERQLQEQLKRVDVVLEVRDARIPFATHHPNVDRWIGEKASVLVLNRVDMIEPDLRHQWQAWFKEKGDRPHFVNAKQGKGIGPIAQAAKSAGKAMNDRRISRGMKPRPVRAVVIGFPNVGKSALINRLLKKKVVQSARRPGVTRQLRWVRISEEIELLDAPGVLPSKLTNQDAALKLAICDDIGQAGYDNQRVASACIDLLKRSPQWQLFLLDTFIQRYQLDPTDSTGEGYLSDVADHLYQGDKERIARQILQDFRTGILGKPSLEFPPASSTTAQTTSPSS